MSLQSGNDQDSYVQVAADGAGKKIDNAELTREDGEVVYRQRTVIGSDENPRVQATVDGEKGSAYLLVDSKSFDEMTEKIQELIDVIKFIHGIDS